MKKVRIFRAWFSHYCAHALSGFTEEHLPDGWVRLSTLKIITGLTSWATATQPAKTLLPATLSQSAVVATSNFRQNHPWNPCRTWPHPQLWPFSTWLLCLRRWLGTWPQRADHSSLAFSPGGTTLFTSPGLHRHYSSLWGLLLYQSEGAFSGLLRPQTSPCELSLSSCSQWALHNLQTWRSPQRHCPLSWPSPFLPSRCQMEPWKRRPHWHQWRSRSTYPLTFRLPLLHPRQTFLVQSKFHYRGASPASVHGLCRAYSRGRPSHRHRSCPPGGPSSGRSRSFLWSSGHGFLRPTTDRRRPSILSCLRFSGGTPLSLFMQKVMIWARARVSPLGRIRASTMVKLKANTKPRIREPLPTKAAHMQGTKGRAAKTISWGKEKVRGGG